MEFLKKILSGLVRSRAGIRIAKAEHQAHGYWKKLGPGLTTGAADDDPSGIATYSQVGAQYGNMFGWMAIFTYPLMSVVQIMCAKIGLVTNRGLAANIRLHYPRWILYVLTALLFGANAFNIGADLGAMAEATRLVFPQFSFAWLVIGFTVFSLALQIFTSYKAYASYLKWLALILFAYIFTAFTIDLDWSQILNYAFIPHMVFDKEHLLIVAAILGTTISPYLFFWQTSQEVEEKILHGTVVEGQVSSEAASLPMIENISEGDIKDMRIDVWSGMFISNLVMFFIIIVCSATLFKNGITDIKTAADAANALRPLAGNGAYLLFAIGIIGTGLLAVPILAGSASYALSESFRWVSGLHHRLREAYAFYAVIIISMLVGLGLNFIGLDPIKALIYSAVANCIVAPIVLVFIVALSSRRDVMGDHANGKVSKTIGWGVTVLMAGVAIATCLALLM
jgi:NRAMP (natural resistance-associated macrophage protein)-like metal ion transporter